MTSNEAATVLRRDAAANRRRILEVAGRLFAQRGLDASMDEIARAAGVGAGTLYRRFPTKESLLDAILLDGLQQFFEHAQAAAREPDAFAGLELWFARALQLQLGSHAVREVLMLRPRDTPHLADARARIRPLLARTLARAKEQGSLRSDVTVEDVSMLLWQLGWVVEFTGSRSPELWRRYLALTLDGLRASSAHPLPQPSPRMALIDLAMSDAAERRGLHCAEPSR